MVVLVMAGSLALSLGLAEVALRCVKPRFFSWPIHNYHPTLGWTGWPSQNHYHGVDGRLVRYPTNPVGFRDQVHSVRVPEGVRRVVLVGDSFSEAAQVEVEATFWSRMRRILCRNSTEYWDVVNLGMGDWGPVQELVALREIGLGYHPDVVVVQVFPLNDILNSSLSGAYLGAVNDTYRPYLDPADDFRSITYLNPTMTWLRQRSLLCRHAFLFASQRVGRIGDERYFRSAAEQQVFSREWSVRLGLPDDISVPANFNAFAPPAEQLDVIREGWTATERALQEMHRLARGAGARMIVLVVVHQHELVVEVDRWRQRLPFHYEPELAHERLARLFAGTDVEVVSLLDTFNGRVHEVYSYLQGHFNPAAHQIVAEVLAARVMELFPGSFPRGALLGDDFESGETAAWSGVER